MRRVWYVVAALFVGWAALAGRAIYFAARPAYLCERSTGPDYYLCQPLIAHREAVILWALSSGLVIFGPLALAWALLSDRLNLRNRAPREARKADQPRRLP
jgi:hypothetical protein